MQLFNPIELLELNYYEFQRLNSDVIKDAIHKLRIKTTESAVTYHGQPVTSEMLNEAESLLQDSQQVTFYYYLAKYPGLSAFLSGDDYADIEAESLNLHAGKLEKRTAELLAPRANEYLQKALNQETQKPLEAIIKQLKKGSPEFQLAVFSSGRSLLRERLDNIETIATGIEQEIYAYEKLRGLTILREQLPISSLNMLPGIFDELISQIRRQLGKMSYTLAKVDPLLALAIVKYALQIKGEQDYTAMLELAKQQLEQQSTEKRVTKITGLAGVGIFGAIAAFIVLLIGGWYAWSKLQISGQTAASSIESESAPLQYPEREAPAYPYLHLNWWERGYEEPGEGKVALGEAPLFVCFPSMKSKGILQSITVIGDPTYDALVFFFNDKDYFHQAYIPAKSQYVINQQLSGAKISSLQIFGKNWDEAKTSPCGTKGYFTENIYYGGFSSYATDPPYLTLATEDILFLKKRRLMPSREMKADDFFDLLEKYR